MPRLPRIHMEEGIYFVTSVVLHGVKLFRDNADMEEFTALIERYKRQYNFNLLAYALLTKDVHILLKLAPTSTISDIMHAINSTYTKYYNIRYGRSGHLFKGRFRAAIVEKEKYPAELTRLIHLMPVFEGLANTASTYKWSSYSKYLNGEQDAKVILESFSGNIGEAVGTYRDFVESFSKDEYEKFKKYVQRARAIGSESFTSEIEKKFSAEEKKDEEAKEKDSRLSPGGDRRGSDEAHLTLTKVSIGVIGFILVSLSVFAIYSYQASRKVVKNVENIMEQKEQAIKKDLEEAYKADMVSYYRAVSKKLEREMKK